MMKNLIQKNGIDIMNQALEALKSINIDALETEGEEFQVKTKQRCADPIRLAISSHKVEFEVPPKVVFDAMHEILDCVAHAVKYVWKKIKDFFSWVWEKLSNLINATPKQALSTTCAP